MVRGLAPNVERGGGVRADLLAELSDLFVAEAFAATRRGEDDESDRLWGIALELSMKQKRELQRELEAL